jgi:ferrous iron transport protein B
MGCHTAEPEVSPAQEGLVILAGQPNVGKSVLFKRLTGHYATVSNYPGTTVEVTRGSAALAGRRLTVVDAPGINSLQPLTPDEDVTRSLLLRRDAEAVVQVADAKNLSRALFLTLQFAELDIPIVLDLNMMDEARRRGVSVDAGRLSSLLGVDVVTTVATSGHGIAALAEGLSAARVPTISATYSPDIEDAATAIESLLPPDLPGKRWHALALLAGDPALERDLALSPARVEAIERVREDARAGQRRSLAQTITQQRWAAIAEVASEVYATTRRTHTSLAERAGWWAVHPLWGWPILAGVLFLVYKLVGELGAGTLVDFFEGTVFGQWINPAVTGLLAWLGAPALLVDFLAGEYGLLTVGLSYGIGIVLPIVSIFFLVFGVLEDSGYLPRLAVMLNRSFARIGLNGKAVLPMVLGLGCVTMATMTTRVLGTKKERVMATLLLALSVPCSAQLGVVLAMAGGLSTAAVLTWGGVVLGVMLLVGWLAGRLVPGDASDFVMELPPLRPPRLDNLLVKTLARVEWYLKEVIPLFLIATAALFVLARTGILGGIEEAMSPLVVGWLGLPPEASGMLLLGFLRRDYGATGLFDMSRNGLLSPDQVLVSLVVVTLFVPCVATVIMMAKEHGARTAAAIVAFVFPFAFLVGGLVRLIAGGL